VNETARTLSRVMAFGRAVRPDLPAVDRALGELRTLLAREGVPYVIVGGVAVVHHGYARTTQDVDVLVTPADLERIARALAAGGFEPVTTRRWRHQGTGAGLDLLVAGEPIPPAGRGCFPPPASVARSEREPDVAGLAALLTLKLAARRHQDLADTVGLLQPLDEGDYLQIEAAVDAPLRPLLAELRADAVAERGE
jgi:hypothetical protein